MPPNQTKKVKVKPKIYIAKTTLSEIPRRLRKKLHGVTNIYHSTYHDHYEEPGKVGWTDPSKQMNDHENFKYVINRILDSSDNPVCPTVNVNARGVRRLSVWADRHVAKNEYKTTHVVDYDSNQLDQGSPREVLSRREAAKSAPNAPSERLQQREEAVEKFRQVVISNYGNTTKLFKACKKTKDDTVNAEEFANLILRLNIDKMFPVADQELLFEALPQILGSGVSVLDIIGTVDTPAMVAPPGTDLARTHQRTPSNRALIAAQLDERRIAEEYFRNTNGSVKSASALLRPNKDVQTTIVGTTEELPVLGALGETTNDLSELASDRYGNPATQTSTSVLAAYLNATPDVNAKDVPFYDKRAESLNWRRLRAASLAQEVADPEIQQRVRVWEEKKKIGKEVDRLRDALREAKMKKKREGEEEVFVHPLGAHLKITYSIKGTQGTQGTQGTGGAQGTQGAQVASKGGSGRHGSQGGRGPQGAASGWDVRTTRDPADDDLESVSSKGSRGDSPPRGGRMPSEGQGGGGGGGGAGGGGKSGPALVSTAMKGRAQNYALVLADKASAMAQERKDKMGETGGMGGGMGGASPNAGTSIASTEDSYLSAGLGKTNYIYDATEADHADFYPQMPKLFSTKTKLDDPSMILMMEPSHSEPAHHATAKRMAPRNRLDFSRVGVGSCSTLYESRDGTLQEQRGWQSASGEGYGYGFEAGGGRGGERGGEGGGGRGGERDRDREGKTVWQQSTTADYFPPLLYEASKPVSRNLISDSETDLRKIKATRQARYDRGVNNYQGTLKRLEDFENDKHAKEVFNVKARNESAIRYDATVFQGDVKHFRSQPLQVMATKASELSDRMWGGTQGAVNDAIVQRDERDFQTTHRSSYVNSVSRRSNTGTLGW